MKLKRQSDVLELLNYADVKFNEFGNSLFDRGMHGRSMKFMSLCAGTVLSSVREAFDICANDIEENIIATARSNVKKYYYPFYKNQLIKKKAALFPLRNINRPLHCYLFAVAAKIERQATTDIGPTLRVKDATLRVGQTVNYRMLREMNDMVNQKKHSKLLVIESRGESLFSEQKVGGGAVRMMLPSASRGNTRDTLYIELPPEAEVTTTDQLVFEYNKTEVMTFMGGCCLLARVIMGAIYKEMWTDSTAWALGSG